jgi:hypothetical protein
MKDWPQNRTSQRNSVYDATKSTNTGYEGYPSVTSGALFLMLY